MRPKHLRRVGPGFHSFEEPRLSERELEYLFLHVLCVPEVYDEAMPFVMKGFLGDIDSFKDEVFVRCLREVHPKCKSGPRSKSFLAQIRAALVRHRDDQVFGGIYEDVVDELLDEDGGLIERALHPDRESLDKEYGLRLLKILLIESSIVKPLSNILSETNISGGTPKKLRQILIECEERLQRLDLLTARKPSTVGELWDEHTRQLSEIRGREFLGLKTGLKELDRRTLGIRGITVLGAKPGAGKTTLTLNMAVGVCRFAKENDCAVLFVSLDMNKFEVMSRIHCLLADIPWKTLVHGSIDEGSRLADTLFSAADQKKLANAEKLLRADQIDKRLTVVDREEVGDDATAERLGAMLHDAKSKVGASRGLIVIDYLQLLSVPDDVNEAGDLGADKYRIRLVQRILQGTRTEANPLGDAAIVISEARKPSSSKDIWGDSMSELMGSARIGYAADAVLLYREMSKKELAAHYGVAPEMVDQKRASLLENGIVPVTLILEKGRDGMTRGPWSMEFYFKSSQFEELSARRSSFYSSHSLDDRESPEDSAEPPEERSSPAGGRKIPTRSGDLRSRSRNRTKNRPAK